MKLSHYFDLYTTVKNITSVNNLCDNAAHCAMWFYWTDGPKWQVRGTDQKSLFFYGLCRSSCFQVISSAWTSTCI